MNEELRKLSLKEIQQEALKVLVKFDSICKEHNWSYSLVYGTLLGAVRHKGFIPWDDDVDVQMPRKDYIQFIKWCCENEGVLKPFKLCNRETVKNYPFGISRFSNMEFKFITTNESLAPFDNGVFIDIYPFDNSCNSEEEGSILMKKINKLNSEVAIFLNGKSNKSMIRSFVKRIIHIFLKLTKPKNFPALADEKISQIIQNNTSDNDIYTGCPAWVTETFKQYKKEWFKETKDILFEDHLFPVPIGYDAFLKFCYGDYLKLPPEEKRTPSHDYIIVPRV